MVQRGSVKPAPAVLPPDADDFAALVIVARLAVVQVHPEVLVLELGARDVGLVLDVLLLLREVAERVQLGAGVDFYFI